MSKTNNEAAPVSIEAYINIFTPNGRSLWGALFNRGVPEPEGNVILYWSYIKFRFDGVFYISCNEVYVTKFS